MDQHRRNRRALAFLVFSLYSAVLLPRALHHGMFLDGVHFASVARNLAEGVGSFWAPHYTQTVYPVEDEHPPLGFWLLSLAFRLFGDSTAVEAFYGYGVGLLNVALLMALWRRLQGSRPEMAGAWFPALFYVAIPMTSTSYASNLLENPMTTFDLAAAMLACWALEARRRSAKAALGLAGGALVFLAVLTKGPPGTFVLVLPMVFASLSKERSWRTGLEVVALQVAGLLLTAALVILPDETARLHTGIHYKRQILGSLQGHGSTGSRYLVLRVLISELAVPAVLGGLGWLATRAPIERRDLRPALGFSVAGLAGVLPFVVTTKQYRRYAFPAMPFFAIGLAYLLNGVGRRLEGSMASGARRALYSFGGVLWVVAIGLMLDGAGDVRKSREFHRDFTLQPIELEERPRISVCPPSLAHDWELVANMQRTLRASLDPAPGAGLWLTESGQGCEAPPGCELIHPPESHRYLLHRCAAL